MIKKLTVIISLLIVLTITTSFVLRYLNGIAGYTGSPGEVTCTSCHLQSSSSGSISVSGSPAFIAGKYIPSQTYTINVTLKHQTLINFGFDCEIVNGATPAAVDAGYIYQILNQGTIVAVNTGNGRTNVLHGNIAAGTGIGPFTKVFKFRWVAPISGAAIIYVAGIAVNSDNSVTGDYTKTTSLSLSPGSATSIMPANKELLTLSIYPNPTSSEITMNCDLLNEGNLKGILYNLQGKEIAVLFNSYQPSGIFSKTVLLPNDIESGIYLLKLSFNGKEIAEKIIFKQ